MAGGPMVLGETVDQERFLHGTVQVSEERSEGSMTWSG